MRRANRPTIQKFIVNRWLRCPRSRRQVHREIGQRTNPLAVIVAKYTNRLRYPVEWVALSYQFPIKRRNVLSLHLRTIRI